MIDALTAAWKDTSKMHSFTGDDNKKHFVFYRIRKFGFVTTKNCLDESTGNSHNKRIFIFPFTNVFID